MLVKDAINGIAKGQITRKQLAEQYAISTRTISKKIAQLGYVYDKKTRTYAFIGDDLQKVGYTECGDLFRQNIRTY